MIPGFEKSGACRKLLRFPRGHCAAQIAGRKRRGINARAFTLLELVVVVAVMGIILLMGVPAIRSATHRDPMSQAVVDFVNACQGSTEHPGARSLAILKGKVMELRIFPQERRIEVGEARTAANSGAAAANLAEPAADAVPKPAAATGYSATISDRVGFRLLEVNFLDSRQADEATVQFYPDGTSDEFTVMLVSDTGEVRKITLDIVTGLPEVTNLQ
jgi:prepilin-type N-terminal cleavage/methylation domain-containing protein